MKVVYEMLYERIQVFTRKPGARFHTLKTNETRVKRRALTSQRACGDACGDARARSRTSNGQACTNPFWSLGFWIYHMLLRLMSKMSYFRGMCTCKLHLHVWGGTSLDFVFLRARVFYVLWPPDHTKLFTTETIESIFEKFR